MSHTHTHIYTHTGYDAVPQYESHNGKLPSVIILISGLWGNPSFNISKDKGIWVAMEIEFGKVFDDNRFVTS